MTEAEDRLARMMKSWTDIKDDEPKGRCCCRKHWEEDHNRHAVGKDGVLWNPVGMPFMMCKTCGNKRCPKATDCSLECTGSNEPGQPGSIY